ncbi:putative cathepsin E [Roridomyces roridus]|uniref:Cathepsin E n=1 Tax=Roridomyces roridus TaxID=1738132 RepID=A0AAD7BHF5_9AGAR|nr:putative cathepsin E [Roridomyces roridus]
MARVALSAALFTFVAGFTSALTIDERHAPVVRASLVRLSTITNTSNIVAQDNARLSKFKAGSEFVATGSGTAVNEVVTYIVKTVVGSQTFNLIVDTGSSNTWVGANTKYTPGSTSQSTGQTVSVTYGSGHGNEYIDLVSIGGEAVKQSIGVATSSNGFGGLDGILGLGPEGLTQNTLPTFMQNLLSQGKISTNVLGVSFAPLSGSASQASNGELTFGGVDSSRYTGSITFTNAIAPYWGVSPNQFKIGSVSLLGSASGIVDTGTTLIYIPSFVFTEFLLGTGGRSDSSTGLVKYRKKPSANFSFVIGGTTYTLAPDQYLVPAAQYGNFGLTSGAFYAVVADGGVQSPNMILGMSFLEYYYSVYDSTNNRIGLARAR